VFVINGKETKTHRGGKEVHEKQRGRQRIKGGLKKCGKRKSPSRRGPVHLIASGTRIPPHSRGVKDFQPGADNDRTNGNKSGPLSRTLPNSIKTKNKEEHEKEVIA